MFYKLPSTPLYFLIVFTFRSFYLAALLDDTEDDPLKMDILDKADLLSEFDEEFSKKGQRTHQTRRPEVEQRIVE